MSDSPRSPLESLRIPEPPEFQLPLPVRYVRPVKQALGDAYKGAYALGAADGFNLGSSLGYEAGHVAGAIEFGVLGSVFTAVAFGLILFVALLVRGKR